MDKDLRRLAERKRKIEEEQAKERKQTLLERRRARDIRRFESGENVEILDERLIQEDISHLEEFIEERHSRQTGSEGNIEEREEREAREKRRSNKKNNNNNDNNNNNNNKQQQQQ